MVAVRAGVRDINRPRVVAVGRSELQALEEQMIQTGAELLVSKPGQRTATESANDAEANKSEL